MNNNKAKKIKKERTKKQPKLQDPQFMVKKAEY